MLCHFLTMAISDRSEMQEGMFIKENSKYVEKSEQTLAVENNTI